MQAKLLPICTSFAAACIVSGPTLGQTTTRVSLSTLGAESDAACDWPTISDDGAFVAFDSRATTLTASDPDYEDVFLRDRANGTTTRVSAGTGANTGDSYFASLSADGALVVFESTATNLVAGDTNGASDVFLYDGSSLTRISVDGSGVQGSLSSGQPDISPDGRYVAFVSDCPTFDTTTSDTNLASDIYLRDRTALTTQRISVRTVGTAIVEANSSSDWPSISANGTYVAFGSYANNLIASDTNSAMDIFSWDSTGQVVRVSEGVGGDADGDSRHPSISADGRYVVYWSLATNLLAPGPIVDSNALADVFLWDRNTATTRVVSAERTHTATGNGYSAYGSISRDGLFVTFTSNASDLVYNDTNGVEDVFLFDCTTGKTARVSVSTLGVESADDSNVLPRRCVANAGAVLTFASASPILDLSSVDANAVADVFVRETCGRPTSFTYCPPGTSTHGCQATISASGVPSASATSGFVISASGLDGQKAGFIFYSPTSTFLTFGPTSHLCVQQPSQGKGAPMFSGGTLGACDGTLSLDWCAFNAGHPWSFGLYPDGFTAGATIYAQAWYRDPPSSPKTAQLSNAIEFGLCP